MECAKDRRKGLRKLRAARYAARLLFGIALSLLLLEALLRLYNPIQSRIKGQRIVLSTNTRIQFPNHVIKQLDPVITVSYNSIGFRGPDPPPDFGDYLTIVAIGSSTTECSMQSDGKTWPDRLAFLLGKSFRSVWVNNAGKDGHSTFGHIVLLEDMVTKLHPKVALFLVGEADIAKNQMNGFELENVKGGVQFSSLKVFVKSLSAYSEVAALGANLYRSFTAFQAGLIKSNIDLRKLGYLDAPAEAEKQYVMTAAKPGFLSNYELRLKQLIADCRQAHIQPVLITNPLLLGAGIDDVTGVDLARIALDQRTNGRMAWEALEIYNGVTRRVGLEENVPVVDLAREMPKSSRYFYDFIHMTNEGGEKAAEIIFHDLCPLLAKDYSPYVRDACAD
jgi:GDSL-like lipase/acylhydrolase family protein